MEPQVPLGAFPARLTDRLDHWAAIAPDRPFLVRRKFSGAWAHLSYAEFRRSARNLAQALIDRKIEPTRPVAILSGNSLEHAIVAFGAVYAGVPFAPISPAYALVATDLARLKSIFSLLTPGLIFADDGAVYENALRAVATSDTPLLVVKNLPQGLRAEYFSDFVATSARADVDRANLATGPDTIAKILFTSGSAGLPKGVITTHRMLCSNQEMLRTVFPFLADGGLVISDWLPWHHTFGGSHNFGLVLHNGGTMYIDDGRPILGAFEETIRNLSEIAPTVYFNVPKGFEMLLRRLQQDAALCERFFSRLQMMFYAGAALPQHIWDGFDAMAMQTRGQRIPILTGLGATETAPFAMCANERNTRAGVVGLPVPGVRLKLAPVNGKLEVRVKGPNVTPGFWCQAAATRSAFDCEGYYQLGDAVRFLDPADPQKGFLFDGRIAEDFKLSTGTWVSVGPLRAKFIEHFAPYVKDVVIAGADRSELTALIFPDLDEFDRLQAQGEMRPVFSRLLRTLADRSTGSSHRIERAIIIDGEPSLDAGERTDKGSVNQRVVLEKRADLVQKLYSAPYSDEVIIVRA